MRVFLTGATGFIGSAIIPELIGAGHTVLGLTRSAEGAKALAALGIESHLGSLEDPDSLRAGAAKADAVIHCAFDHNFTKFAENGEKDARASPLSRRAAPRPKTVAALRKARKFELVDRNMLCIPSGRLTHDGGSCSPVSRLSALLRPRVAGLAGLDTGCARALRQLWRPLNRRSSRSAAPPSAPIPAVWRTSEQTVMTR